MEMIEVYLYGGLRRYASDPRPDRESVARLEPHPGETVRTTLERLGIPPADVYHIFLNGALLFTRNSMAPWLEYQQSQAGAPNQLQALDAPVQTGDRVGLFARDMALLVV
jgi:hypothetical protein